MEEVLEVWHDRKSGMTEVRMVKTSKLAPQYVEAILVEILKEITDYEELDQCDVGVPNPAFYLSGTETIN